MTFSIQQRVKRLSAKDQHRLFQMMQPPIDLRRFAHFTAQSLKFEELEKREKNPIRSEYYHKLNILKQERAMMYMRRYYNRHYASIDRALMQSSDNLHCFSHDLRAMQADDVSVFR